MNFLQIQIINFQPHSWNNLSFPHLSAMTPRASLRMWFAVLCSTAHLSCLPLSTHHLTLPFAAQACSLLGQAPLPLALPFMPTSWSKANTQYPEQQPSFIYWIAQKVHLSFSHKVLWKNRNKLSGHPNTLCLLILDLLVFCHQRSYRHHQQYLGSAYKWTRTNVHLWKSKQRLTEYERD